MFLWDSDLRCLIWSDLCVHASSYGQCCRFLASSGSFVNELLVLRWHKRYVERRGYGESKTGEDAMTFVASTSSGSSHENAMVVYSFQPQSTCTLLRTP